MIKNIKKLNIIPNNHLLLNQNWNFISKKINIFHNKNSKINFYEWLDKEFKEKNIKGKWSGFLHNVINYPEEYPKKYENKILPLSKLVKDYYFLDKLNDCKKIIVFTDQIKNFLTEQTKFYQFESIKHPEPDYIFRKSWTGNCKRVLHVGQQLRKYQSFLDLITKKEKIMLSPIKMENDILEMKNYSENLVFVKNNVDLKEYLELISDCVVFLDLYDVAACNTILECIIMNVPILVRNLEGCVEYLGKDYPFYFDNLDEANYKIDDEDLILKTNIYLYNLNKDRYKINNFLFNFYKNICFFSNKEMHQSKF